MSRVVTILAALLCVAAPVRASGIVSLTWDGCTGPLNKTVLPGSHASLFASVIGHSEPHKGYEVRLLLSQDCSDPNHPVSAAFPDAWRFDTGGCQPPAALYIDHLAPAEVAGGCPSFMQWPAPSFQVKKLIYDPIPGTAVIILANVYSDGVASVDPNQRYFLARFEFDQANGVTGPSGGGHCGGLESPMCVQLINQEWLTMNGESRFWPRENNCVSVNDPVHTSGCDVPTPARPTTWGAIRGQYR